jgi:ribosomal protein S3AE
MQVYVLSMVRSRKAKMIEAETVTVEDGSLLETQAELMFTTNSAEVRAGYYIK